MNDINDTNPTTPWSLRPELSPAGLLVAAVILDSNGDEIMRFDTDDDNMLFAALTIVRQANTKAHTVKILQTSYRYVV